ncbi:hypothetical protein, partial [Leptotrichia wadei]
AKADTSQEAPVSKSGSSSHNDQIKIFNANKEIYIKKNNYFFDKDDLKLKIKNVDRILLPSNLVFLPMHYKIKG